MEVVSLGDMQLLAAVSSGLVDIVGAACRSPTDVGFGILREYRSYMMAVGYYGTGVQVVGVPLFDELLVVVPGSELYFECLDQFHIAHLVDC